jgi:hypothetical protein
MLFAGESILEDRHELRAHENLRKRMVDEVQSWRTWCVY